MPFWSMTEAEMRQWVEGNPGLVYCALQEAVFNCRPPLDPPAYPPKSLALILWLLDEKGADLNARRYAGDTLIFRAPSPASARRSLGATC